MILNYPLGLLALLGVPVIILLYLLKQKREDYVISSLYLWRSALRDIEANAPWQKLKRNILMFLQIIAVILLSLLLSRPVIPGVKSSGGDILIVIDCSLSMQSNDVKPTRYEAAINDAVELVESSSSGTRYSIVSSSHMPYIVINNADDKQKVIQELRNLTATDTAEDREATYMLVQSLIRENHDVQVNWFSDGINTFNGDNIRYYSYNRNGENYAVTLLSHRKLSGEEGITALSRIANYSLTEADIDVSLYTDGVFFDARRVRIEPESSQNLYWSGIHSDVSKLECRIDTEDVLLKDNFAGAMVNQADNSKVLLASNKNVFLEKLLEIIPNIDVFRTDLEDMAEMKGYDLYIFDGDMPEVWPDDGHLMIFNPPENIYFSTKGISEYTEIRGVNHAIFNSLDQDISFGALKSAFYELPEWANPLMENDKGVHAFEGYLDNRRIMVFGFNLQETNLPVQPLFPVVMTRAVQQFLSVGAADISSVYAGDTIEISIDPEALEVYIFNPLDVKTVIGPPFPVVGFSDTTAAGLYTLVQQLENDKIEQQFFVNAPTEKEFNTSKNNVEAGQNLDTERDRDKTGSWNLQALILWTLLGLLILEWWIYVNGNSV